MQVGATGDMAEPQDDSLNLLLDELESRAQQQQGARKEEGYWVCKRKHPRNPFRSGCNIYFFPPESLTVCSLAGRTRNLSRTGVGLLSRRVFTTGEPVEVEILLPDRPNMYLAGLVTFCRYAGRGYHEIGICLQTAGSTPIFCRNPIAAMEAYPWLRPPVDKT